MTIKPFCISTLNLSGREIAFAIDLCVKYGCIGYECVGAYSGPTCFEQLYDHNDFELFGVDSRGRTVLWDKVEDFGIGAVKITIDQLPAHLGINKIETPEKKESFDSMSKVEWNGEGLPPIGVECEYFDKGHSDKWILVKVKYSSEWGVVVESLGVGAGVELFFNHYDGKKFRKLETPQQREKREAVENLRDAIQRCEDVGAAVYYGNELIIGAIIDGKSTSLVKG